MTPFLKCSKKDDALIKIPISHQFLISQSTNKWEFFPGKIAKKSQILIDFQELKMISKCKCAKSGIICTLG